MAGIAFDKGQWVCYLMVDELRPILAQLITLGLGYQFLLPPCRG